MRNFAAQKSSNMEHINLILFISACIITAIVILIRWLYARSMRIRSQLQMNYIFNNITHELLTPLTIISASVDKLREDHPDSRYDLDLMDLNIQRSVRLLQQILETSKLQAGELRILVSQGYVMQYIKETARSLEPLMVRKHLTFTVNCKPESMMGWLDTDKMDKIIFNLLSNAAKYTPEGGSVTLNVATNNRFDHIIIQVQDTGVGIPKEKMKHLFTRFYDGDYRNNRTSGTGLGLALTRDLIYLHGGQISCESVEGQGTTFTVNVPINKEAFAPSQIDERNKMQIHIPEASIADLPKAEYMTEDKAPTPEAGASHILIVEDNKEISELLADFLKKEGFLVSVAPSGEEALDKFGKYGARMVLLDIMLPGMDGYAVCSEIRQNSNVPIFILSAKTAKDDKINGLLLGADDYIEKPYDIDILIAKVKGLFARRYSSDEISSGNITINKADYKVYKDGEPVEMTIKEYELMLLLVENEGKVLTKEFLFGRIWGFDSDSEQQTLTVHITRLRQKIEEDPKSPKRIVTVWGKGYKFE